MIAFLKGRVIHSEPDRSLIILETGGVGYEVFLPVTPSYFSKFFVSKELSVFIYTYVREDRITLYGFPNIAQREIFSILLDVKNVGPKLAVTILSNINENEFLNIIITQDIARLAEVKGIGKAVAERIIVELKNKFAKKGFTFKDIKASDIGASFSRAPFYAGQDRNNNYNYDNSACGDSACPGREKPGTILTSSAAKQIKAYGDDGSNRDQVSKFTASNGTESNMLFETALALESLGYSRSESLEIAGKIYKLSLNKENAEAVSSEFLTKECLKYIYSLKNTD